MAKAKKQDKPSEAEETELRSSDEPQSPSGMQKSTEPDHSQDGSTSHVGMTGQRKAKV